MPNHPDRLEQLIDRTVRGLPPRRAPAALESQVLAQIERRLARPWWRMSYAHWPAPARLCFLIVCAALVALVVRTSGWVITGVESHALTDLSLTSVAPTATSITTATIAAASSVARIIPSLWIYCGLGIIAVMYTSLFGIGAAAYRTLYADR